MSKQKGESQPGADGARARNPRREKGSGRAATTTTGRTGADQSPRQAERTAITDEGLGLLPADVAERNREDVSDVVGPDRDDLELSVTGGLEFAEGRIGSDTQGGPIDFHEGERQQQAQVIAEETELTTVPHTLAEAPGGKPDVEPDWTDQTMLTDPVAAVGAPDENADPVSDTDETYIAPTDPVVTPAGPGNAQVLGGFSPTGAEEVHPARSSDGEIGDEAIADAVREALRQDASTTALEIHVAVARGVVRLRGVVSDLDDADNAEAVAARVEGVLEVQEQLTVSS